MTSVREINILLTMDHPNIVNVSEVVTGFKKDGSQDVYMVMEFVQQDLKSFLGKYQARLKIGEVRAQRSEHCNQEQVVIGMQRTFDVLNRETDGGVSTALVI